jgi:hypothetical protein
VLAAAIITGLRLARDPRAGCQTERAVNAVEDGIFLALPDEAVSDCTQPILVPPRKRMAGLRYYPMLLQPLS